MGYSFGNSNSFLSRAFFKISAISLGTIRDLVMDYSFANSFLSRAFLN